MDARSLFAAPTLESLKTHGSLAYATGPKCGPHCWASCLPSVRNRSCSSSVSGWYRFTICTFFRSCSQLWTPRFSVATPGTASE